MIPICIAAIEDESDRSFMERLYFSYRGLMYSQLQKWLTDSWDVEDAMQTVLVKLIDKLSLLKRLDENRLAGYICAACRSGVVDLLRKKEPNRSLPLDESLDSLHEKDGRELEWKLIRADQLTALARCFSRLDDRTRFLLEGYYLLEKSPRELGRELGISADSVRMALVWARRKAYECMEGQAAAPPGTLGTDL